MPNADDQAVDGRGEGCLPDGDFMGKVAAVSYVMPRLEVMSEDGRQQVQVWPAGEGVAVRVHIPGDAHNDVAVLLDAKTTGKVMDWLQEWMYSA